MEEAGCIFCKGKSSEVFWEENGYTGRRCSHCGLIYLSPRPSENEMAMLYDVDLSGGWTGQKHIISSFFKYLVNRHTLTLVKRYKTKGDILEIGPGGGQFLIYAREKGFNPFAVEINKELADYISKKLKIEVENVSVSSNKYFVSREFDIIYHKDVLSHLHEPIDTFKNLNSKLKHDGILIFETGNFGNLSRFWLNFLSRLGFPEHLYLFSIENVKRLLNICGFELVVYYCHGIILHQLISKILEWIRHVFKLPFLPHGITSVGVHEGKVKWRFARNIKDYITYFLVYDLGRIFPQNWPSTVIYIARKLTA